MKILFDEDAPRPLRRYLPGHDIITVQEMGWGGIKNGRLLTLAEEQNFDVLLTFDQNMRYQQRLENRKIAVVVVAVPNKRLPTILPLVPELLALLPTTQGGEVYTVQHRPDSQQIQAHDAN